MKEKETLTDNRDSVIFYRSFYEAIKELKPPEKSIIYEAIFEFSLNFNEIKLDGICKTIFTLIKPQLVANNKKFLNGKKPKQKQNRSKTEAKQKQNISKTEANANKNANENVNENVNALPFGKNKDYYKPDGTIFDDRPTLAIHDNCSIKGETMDVVDIKPSDTGPMYYYRKRWRQENAK